MEVLRACELSEVYRISKQLAIKLQFYCTKNDVDNSINKDES